MRTLLGRFGCIMTEYDRVRSFRLVNGLRPHPRPLAEEGRDVGGFFDDLAGRLAAAMAGARLDADEVGLFADIFPRLQRRDIFEAVAGADAVVGIGGRPQPRRLVAPAP